MKKNNRPECLMMTYGYKPELSEGAVKPPIFQPSTFAFKTAQEGKAFFETVYSTQKKRIFNALKSSSSDSVIKFKDVLTKIINGR